MVEHHVMRKTWRIVIGGHCGWIDDGVNCGNEERYGQCTQVNAVQPLVDSHFNSNGLIVSLRPSSQADSRLATQFIPILLCSDGRQSASPDCEFQRVVHRCST